MKEDLFDDIISTDVSEEINNLFTGIYDINDLKLYLYLETNNDIFKKTEIYDIKSDIKYLRFYAESNQILVTTGFFKLSESDKVDILKKYVLDKEKYIGKKKYVLNKERYIGNNKLKDVVPYSYNDICKKIIEIIDNSTISRSLKYKVINYIDYSTPDINKIYANITFGRDTLYWFELINDDILINIIMRIMSTDFLLSLPKTTEGKLRRAIAKINKKNKD